MMLSLLTFNVNGLHDDGKWHKVWQFLKSQSTDVICLQETHLTAKQEYAFCLYAQGYTLLFSHGTSRSAGVLIGICRNKGISILNHKAISPHLMLTDLNIGDDLIRIINIYAPIDHKERQQLFCDLDQLVIPDNTIVLGDFNLVRDSSD